MLIGHLRGESYNKRGRVDVIITVLRVSVVIRNQFDNDMDDAELLILFLTYLDSRRIFVMYYFKKD